MPSDQPSIRFFEGPTGHRVAYAVQGDGPPLMFSAWWVSHVEEDWNDESFRHFFGSLAEHFTVVRYDRPGSGLSDRERERVDVEDEKKTLVAVCDHLELSRLSLFGLTCATPPALQFAVEQPGRIERLMLFGSYLQGHKVAPQPVQKAITELVRASWGMGVKLITDLFDPNLEGETRAVFNTLQRKSASKEMAAQLLQLTFQTDVSDLAAEIGSPALVMHRKGDRAIPFRAGRELAAAMRDATFLPFEGNEHVPWRGDSDAVLEAMVDFAGVGRKATAPSETHEYSLERKGEAWALTFEGEMVLLNDARGLTDLAILLGSPGTEVHVGTLWAGADASAEMVATDEPVLDESALAAYKKRLRTLERRLEDAEGAQEKKLRAERDALVKELRGAVGLGGRKRALDATAERARKAVTARLRASIRKITEVLPPAGLHLEKHVITGTYCSYPAEGTPAWVIR